MWPGTKLSLYFEKVSNENDVVGVLIRIIEVIEDVEKSSVFSIWASDRASDETQNSEVSHGRRVKIRDRTERVHKASPPRSQAQILRRQRRPPRPRFTSKRRRRDHRLSPSLPHSPRPPPSARDLSHPRNSLSLSLSRFMILYFIMKCSIWIYMESFLNLHVLLDELSCLN